MKPRALALALVMTVTPSLLRAQGALTPPGPPGPTMKTLSQVEPRTPISSLPFTITNPGSYYLTATLTGAAGQSGIIVQADNVTVDLAGFGLLGTAGSLHGITAAPGRQNLILLNGILQGWGGNGLEAAGAQNCRVSQVLAANNGGAGLSIGANGSVRDCLALANTGDGVRVSTSCLVFNNACNSNGAAATGIHATGAGNRLEANHLAGNLGGGIQVDGPGNLIVKNSATASGGSDYVIATGNSYGQLVQAPGPGFTNATAWANFSSSCPAGFSFCGGVCVSLSSDVNNCGACGNACSFANASAGCNSGTCVLVSCNTGFADCDNNPANGCEKNVQSDPSNCGGCGTVCTLPNAVAGCANGGCIIASCNSGFADCDHNPANGCERNLQTDPSNCGGCGIVCSFANGSGSCTGGSCVLAGCNPGFGNCDGNPANGCETSLNTVNNCGSCGRVCSFPNASAGCNNGSCVLVACNPGFADCDGNPSNGCETSLNTVNNCGACGFACNPVPNSTPFCVNSQCTLACNSGFANCDGNYANGCEVNLTIDNNNCGGCGVACNPNTQQCSNSACKLKSGQACTSNSQCASNVCSGNVCS